MTCADCRACDNLGWQMYFCDVTGQPIDPNAPACISINQKVSAKEAPE